MISVLGTTLLVSGIDSNFGEQLRGSGCANVQMHSDAEDMRRFGAAATTSLGCHVSQCLQYCSDGENFRVLCLGRDSNTSCNLGLNFGLRRLDCLVCIFPTAISAEVVSLTIFTKIQQIVVDLLIV